MSCHKGHPCHNITSGKRRNRGGWRGDGLHYDIQLFWASSKSDGIFLNGAHPHTCVLTTINLPVPPALPDISMPPLVQHREKKREPQDRPHQALTVWQVTQSFTVINRILTDITVRNMRLCVYCDAEWARGSGSYCAWFSEYGSREPERRP